MKKLLFIPLILLIVSTVGGQQKTINLPNYARIKLQLERNRQLVPNEPFAYFDTSIKRRMLYYPNSGIRDPFESPLKLVDKQNGTASRSSTFSNFSLVKDINTSKDANPANENLYSSSQSFAVLNNVAYYAADNGINGVEL